MMKSSLESSEGNNHKLYFVREIKLVTEKVSQKRLSRMNG
jgi:hypothetical protein